MVLQDISMQCSTGEITGIFGRNGCGKSTLLKILFGTMKATSIDATVDGYPFNPKQNIPDGTIAYLPQDSFLPKGLKVRDVVPMYLESAQQQDAVLYYKGIHRISNTKVGNLSLGEVRYLELVMTGHLDHPFLLLDEPFSMAEPLHKELIKEFLKMQKLTKGIIATDHYYTDILEITDRNILIKDGVAVSVANKAELAANGYLPE